MNKANVVLGLSLLLPLLNTKNGGFNKKSTQKLRTIKPVFETGKRVEKELWIKPISDKEIQIEITYQNGDKYIFFSKAKTPGWTHQKLTAEEMKEPHHKRFILSNLAQAMINGNELFRQSSVGKKGWISINELLFDKPRAKFTKHRSSDGLPKEMVF